VKLIELEAGDQLQAIAPVVGEDKDDTPGKTNQRNNFQERLLARLMIWVRMVTLGLVPGCLLSGFPLHRFPRSEFNLSA
jgi:hypothetical protein